MVQISRSEIFRTLYKLDGLTADLREVLAGTGPAPDRILNAPKLEQWSIVPAPFRVLIGNVSGHPKIRDGEIMTSQLFLIEDGKTWARTFSRYYRLGEKARSS